MVVQSKQSSANALLQENLMMRNALLNTGLRCSQTLPVQTYTAGQGMQFELNSSGILRYLLVSVSGTLTVTLGGGTAAVGVKGPYMQFPKVELVDYVGTTRVNASAYMLNQRDKMNKFGFDEADSVPDTGLDASIYAFAAADGANSLKYSFIVPVMYDENDSRGGILLTVPNGKCYLKLTPSTLLYGTTDDYMVKVTGAATAAFAGTVTVTQYYFNPQTVRVNGRDILPIPVLDLQQVREIIETKSTSNLAAGTDKLFSLPTGRVYHTILEHFYNGSGGPDSTSIDRISFLYDGNTPTIDEGLMAYLTRTRNVYGRDLAKGLFVWDFRKRPWDSNLWGQLQTLLRVASGSTVNAGAYLSVLTDTLYTSTVNLSGIVQ